MAEIRVIGDELWLDSYRIGILFRSGTIPATVRDRAKDMIEASSPAYDRGFNDGKEKGYEDGMADGLEEADQQNEKLRRKLKEAISQIEKAMAAVEDVARSL